MPNALLHGKYVLQYCSSGAMTRKGVGQKLTEHHISENQGFGTNRLARAQTISSHSHHFDRHDWVLQRRGARIFMILYKNNLCSLV